MLYFTVVVAVLHDMICLYFNLNLQLAKGRCSMNLSTFTLILSKTLPGNFHFLLFYTYIFMSIVLYFNFFFKYLHICIIVALLRYHFVIKTLYVASYLMILLMLNNDLLILYRSIIRHKIKYPEYTVVLILLHK